MPLGIVTTEDYDKDLGNKPAEKKHIPEQKDTPKAEDKVIPAESGESSGEKCVRGTVEVLDAIPTGRGIGSTEVPESIRKLIGESAIEEGRGAATAIGKFLGLSDSSVSAYSNGATSTKTYNKKSDELNQFLDKARGRIMKRASGKLYKALDVIDEDKLSKLDAVQASQVARNMGAIIKQMEPDTGGNQTNNGPVITFYAPHIVQENHFESITVSE